MVCLFSPGGLATKIAQLLLEAALLYLIVTRTIHAQDYLAIRNTRDSVPAAMPALVLDGRESPDFKHEAADAWSHTLSFFERTLLCE